MKMVSEYIEHAHQFELLASDEKDAQTKAQLESQAAAYRALAAERAKEIGLISHNTAGSSVTSL